MTERDISLKQDIKPSMWIKSDFLNVKIHQYVKSASRSQHPVTITIKNSIQIHHSFLMEKNGWQRIDIQGSMSKLRRFFERFGTGTTADARCPLAKYLLDRLVTYKGEVSHQSSVCVCVCVFLGGGTSVHRYIFHWKFVQRCCQTVRWIPSGCKGDLKLSVNLGGMLGWTTWNLVLGFNIFHCGIKKWWEPPAGNTVSIEIEQEPMINKPG